MNRGKKKERKKRKEKRKKKDMLHGTDDLRFEITKSVFISGVETCQTSYIYLPINFTNTSCKSVIFVKTNSVFSLTEPF